MDLREVILCSVGLSAENVAGSVTFHDYQSGTSLASFKQTSPEAHCIAAMPSRDGQGGFLLTAQPDKSVMNVYTFQKDQIALRMVLPEKLSCLALDDSGRYCVGGTLQGRIYLWEVASGILFNVWDAHYRKVNVLRFTLDGQALISGSEDSGVSVWAITSLVDNSNLNEIPSPYCKFSDHTLAVIDIICGFGTFPSCRVLTASSDHSVKLWDLATESLISTFLFPKPISCLAFEVTERMFFAASSDGSIHQVNLFRQKEALRGGFEAVSGDAIRIGDKEETWRRLINVNQPVTAIALSMNSSQLLVGTAGGIIHIFDIVSHQLLRSISSHKGSKITYIKTMLKPVDLIGHVDMSLSTGPSESSKDIMPPRSVVPFQRIRDGKAREAHEVLMMLPISSKKQTVPYDYTVEELLEDQAAFIQPLIGGDRRSSAISLQSRVSELETEVHRLREQLGKAKGINDTLWETVVQKVISEKTGTAQDETTSATQIEDQTRVDGDMELAPSPAYKRGRVQ